jgi:RNA polymerase sigma-70 factor (ECF subfamily)
MRTEFLRASDLLRQDTPEAVGEAIGLLQSAVFSFSMKMCGHREDAEDTAQEVLFRSLKHLSKLQEPAALAGWLYTVARNRCRRLRGVAQESPARKLSLNEMMPDETELHELLLDQARSPEQQAVVGEHHDLLQQAVLRIPPQLRMVLVLHDMEELGTAQVAQILNLREGTVRVRLHRARLVLRKEMALALKGGLRSRPAAPRTGRKPGKGSVTGRRPKQCLALFASLSEYLDGRVNAETAKGVRTHMEQCPACVAFLCQLREAIEHCRSLKAECDPAVASRLRAMLTQEYMRMAQIGSGSRALRAG